MKKFVYPLILFFYMCQPAHAALLDTIGGINTLLYGIAAGIAALMITMHAVKWKTAENPGDREDAKKGVINVILALILIMIAATLVSVLFVKPPEPEVPPTTTLKNGSVSTTTTIKAITTTTTTTTIPPEKLLTAKNLVDCIQRVNGKLETILPVSGCAHCRHIKCTVFAEEKDPPVGPGLPEYKRIPPIKVSVGPYWIKADGSSSGGCKTMAEINDYFNCGLIPVPGHVYFKCVEAHNPIQFECEP